MMTKELTISRFHLNSKYVLLLAMLYITASVAADTVAYNFSNVWGFVESGSTFIFPITYVLGDVISEVYGWHTAMRVVWLGLFCEAIFALFITIDIHLKPYTGYGVDVSNFKSALDYTWLFVAGGIVSNSIAGLLNVYLMSKWKILMKGKLFWLRSILSTCIAECILIVVTIIIAFFPFYGAMFSSKVFTNAYILEMAYAIIFVIPAQIMVSFLKKKENIDNYDHNVRYNPFKFIEDVK